MSVRSLSDNRRQPLAEDAPEAVVLDEAPQQGYLLKLDGIDFQNMLLVQPVDLLLTAKQIETCGGKVWNDMANSPQPAVVRTSAWSQVRVQRVGQHTPA
jgi:hypothetical protein